MKSVIQRNLPLDVTYTVTDKKYIPIEHSVGLCCQNCGRIIANIATVRNANGDSFDIGFDCLETVLMNNQLLSSGDIAEYERVKKMIPKIIRFSKSLKETIDANNGRITGIRFEKQTYPSDWYTFYWLSDFKPYNDNVKLKDMDFEFLVNTVKNIFPHLNIITN